ncbi:MAG: NADH:flavin oxidoreductase [Rhizobiales bacterium]|nr:NADH:flavin oxidoreductase [Hyphomicrobiales bacterium]
MSKYSAALEPLKIRNVEFKNRIFLVSMGLDMATVDGAFSNELRSFYLDVAKGGVGAMILSNAAINESTALMPNALKLFNKDHANSFKSVIEDAAKENVIVAAQLQHYGGQGTTFLTRGRPALTPSGIETASIKKIDPKYHVKELTVADIEMTVDGFKKSAQLCVDAGAKFIQLQASNGYLLSSFLSKYTNKRDDDYGGSPAKRSRLLIEVLRAVREVVGSEVVIGIRIGINDYVGDEGLTVEELEPLIPILEESGADIFECSFCIADTFHRLSENTVEMRKELTDQVKIFKSYASAPVGFAGFISSLQEGCDLIESGVVDYIGMARALLADNALVNKELSGHESEVHRCLWEGNCFKDKYNPRYDRVYCCVNPNYLRPQ